MTPLNQDTLKLIEEVVDKLDNRLLISEKHYYKKGLLDALASPILLKSAGVYTLQEMQTQMLNLLEKEEDKWVSVKDRLPEIEMYQASTVLTLGYNEEYVADYQDKNFFSRNDNDDDGNPLNITAHVTHWMPLPNKPTPPNQNI